MSDDQCHTYCQRRARRVDDAEPAAKKNALSNKMMDKMIADIEVITEDRTCWCWCCRRRRIVCSGLDLFDLRESNRRSIASGARSPPSSRAIASEDAADHHRLGARLVP